jgi:hypothetical protein
MQVQGARFMDAQLSQRGDRKIGWFVVSLSLSATDHVATPKVQINTFIGLQHMGRYTASSN